MSRLNSKQIYQLMGYKLGKSTKSCKSYIDCFVNIIINEINRGNEIKVDNFGVFKPRFSGGVDKYVGGVIKYIDPRIGIEFYLTENGLNKVNKEVVNLKEKDKFKKRIVNNELTPSDKELLGIKEEPNITQEDIRKAVRKNVDMFLAKKDWFGTDNDDSDEEGEEDET